MKPNLLLGILLITALPTFAQVPNQLNYQGRVTVSGINYSGPGQFKFALVGPEQNTSTQATGQPVIGGLGDGQGPRVLSITVTAAGSGYTEAPTVTINHPTASGATAHAVLNGTGGVLEIIVDTDGVGQGYDGQTTVILSAPPENFQRFTHWSNDNTSAMGSEPTDAVDVPVAAGLYSVALGNTTLPNMAMLPENLFANHGELYLRVWFNDGTNGFQLLSPDQRLLTAPYSMFAATIPDGSVTSQKIASGAVGTAQISSGAVGTGQLAPGAISPLALNTGVIEPTAGQVLTYTNDGLRWVNSAAGLSLPLVQTAGAAGPLIEITNDGDGMGIESESLFNDGIKGITSMPGKSGVFGLSTAPPPFGNAPRGQGVYGYGSNTALGVLGVSEGNDGVSGRTNASNKAGVFGYSEAAGSKGVYAISTNGDGVVGETGSAAKSGVFGWSAAGNGVTGTSGGSARSGVFGTATAADSFGGSFLNSHPNGVALKAFGRAEIDGNLSVHTLTITGGADLAEPFPMSHGNVEPGSVVIIDESNPGKLRLSHAAYDKKVAGIVSGADGIKPGISMIQEDMLETGENVALSGRVYVKANKSSGDILPGDLLTTSAIPGEAMKASDHGRSQGAILGKAMTGLSDRSGKVLVLVTLQ